MKRLIITFLVIVALLIVVQVNQASAFGLGFYVEGGLGDGEIEFDFPFYDVEKDVDIAHMGIGFALDTAIADALSKSLELDDEDGPVERDFDGVVFINDFGFAIFKRPRARVWIGPELKIGFYEGENQYDEDYNLVTFGLGPALGVNLGITETTFFTVKAAYVFSGFAGEYEGNSGYDYDIEGNMGVGTLNIGLMFKLGE